MGHRVGAWQFYLRPYVGRSLVCGVLILGRYTTIARRQKRSPFTPTTFLNASLSLISSPPPQPVHLCGSVLGPLSPPLSPDVKLVSGVDSEGASPAPAALCSGETPCLLPLLPPPLGVPLPPLCTHLLRCSPRVLPFVQGLRPAGSFS